MREALFFFFSNIASGNGLFIRDLRLEHGCFSILVTYANVYQRPESRPTFVAQK